MGLGLIRRFFCRLLLALLSSFSSWSGAFLWGVDFEEGVGEFDSAGWFLVGGVWGPFGSF